MVNLSHRYEVKIFSSLKIHGRNLLNMTIICAFPLEDKGLQASPLQTLTLSLLSITPWN